MLILLALISLAALILVVLYLWLYLSNPNLEGEEEKYYYDTNHVLNKFPLASFTSRNQPDARAEVSLSVIVPAYNEEKRLAPMMSDCLNYLKTRENRDNSFTYEIIIVDDGSADKTASYALAEWVTNKNNKGESIRVATLKKNRGKGGALKRGVLLSRGQNVLIVDADGATKFSEYEKLEDELERISTSKFTKTPGYAVVCGSRAHMQSSAVKKRGAIRNFLMVGFHLVVKWIGGIKSIKDTQCGFKLFTRDAAMLLFRPLHIERWAFDVELLWIAQKNNIPVSEVPVEWTEIAGSHLEEEDTRIVSVKMFFDLLRFRLSYELGLWEIAKI